MRLSLHESVRWYLKTYKEASGGLPPIASNIAGKLLEEVVELCYQLGMDPDQIKSITETCMEKENARAAAKIGITFNSTKWYEDVTEEMSDVIVNFATLMEVLQLDDLDVMMAGDAKLKKNMTRRTWKINEFGCIAHVKDATSV